MTIAVAIAAGSVTADDLLIGGKTMRGLAVESTRRLLAMD